MSGPRDSSQGRLAFDVIDAWREVMRLLVFFEVSCFYGLR